MEVSYRLLLMDFLIRIVILTLGLLLLVIVFVFCVTPEQLGNHIKILTDRALSGTWIVRKVHTFRVVFRSCMVGVRITFARITRSGLVILSAHLTTEAFGARIRAQESR